MNDICEMWSLPWHALQRNLAKGISGDVVGHSALALKTLNVQSVAVSANSWLSRARHRAAPLPQVRQ
jgi:hypothetical protein